MITENSHMGLCSGSRECKVKPEEQSPGCTEPRVRHLGKEACIGTEGWRRESICHTREARAYREAERPGGRSAAVPGGHPQGRRVLRLNSRVSWCIATVGELSCGGNLI